MPKNGTIMFQKYRVEYSLIWATSIHVIVDVSPKQKGTVFELFWFKIEYRIKPFLSDSVFLCGFRNNVKKITN